MRPRWLVRRMCALLSAFLVCTSTTWAAPPVDTAPWRIEPAAPSHGDLETAPVVGSARAYGVPENARVEPLPSRFDWRESGMVTPVKNVGACGGAVNAFGFTANVESRLLIDGAGSFDLSENQAKECVWEAASHWSGPGGMTMGSCNGGNAWMVANLLSQTGSVLETCDPYVASDVECNTTCPRQQTLLDWRWLGSGMPETEALKRYIYTYGPANCTFCLGWGAWNGEFHRYDGSYTLYHPEQDTSLTLAVLIVGWDDDLVHAGGKGGWIVKNNWGTDWGGTCGYGTERGYFTMAYGSAGIGANANFLLQWQPYDPHGGVLALDEAGYNGDSVGSSSPMAWGLVRLTAPRSGYVRRVEFWTVDRTLDVAVYLYRAFDGQAVSGLVWKQEGLSYGEAGYHSVPVAQSIPLNAGEDVIAVVKITDATVGWPIPVDARGPFETGRSFASLTGADGSWVDVGVLVKCDPGIRVRYSDTAPILPTPTATPTTGPLSAHLYLPVMVRAGD